MSYGSDAPEREPGVPPVDPETQSSAIESLRRHFTEWSRRYVEMREEAIESRK